MDPLTFISNEYTYQLNPFKEILQINTKSKSQNSMGKYISWKTNNKYQEMIYDHGDTCWNGPPRTTTVKFQCGLDDKILSVTEPGKCEYELSLISPAACLQSVLDTMIKRRDILLEKNKQ